MPLARRLKLDHYSRTRLTRFKYCRHEVLVTQSGLASCAGPVSQADSAVAGDCSILRRIANEEMGLEIEPLFWSTLGLVTCLLFGMACLGWVSVFGTLGLFSLSGFYLVWNGCYLAMLWQVGSRA